MGRRMQYLELIKKTGAYRFRRGIPAHLAKYFPTRGVVWREHLNTKDYDEARLLCLEVSAKVEGIFQQAEARYDADNGVGSAVAPAVSVQFLKRLANYWREAERSRRAQLLVVGDVMPGWSEFIAEVQLVGLPNSKKDSELPQSLRDWYNSISDKKRESPEEFMGRLGSEHAYICRVIEEITHAEGLLIDEHHPSHGILWKLIRDAWIDVLESELRWRFADLDDIPTEEPPPRPSAPPRKPEPESVPVPNAPQPRSAEHQVSPENPLFSEAFDVWLRLNKPSKRTEGEAKTALRQFNQMHGDLPVRSISKAHARAFRDVLALVPKNLPAKLRLLPLQKLVEVAKGEVRAPQTVNKTMNLLSAILSCQSKEGAFDHLPWSNPFSVLLPVEADDEDNYEPLNDTDLRALFGSPVLSGGHRPKQGRGETAFWAPLLVLFHGTRRQDVLQLFVRDIVTDPDTGIVLIDVNRDDGKKVKNEESVRQIPLHPVVVELGFLDWLAKRKAEVGPDGSLWPGFEDRAKLDGRINRWSKWFNEYLALHVVDHPRKKLHSLRGTFKRVGRGCGVADPILDKICGHAVGGVGANYGRSKRKNGGRDSGYPLHVIASEVGRVRFEGQDSISISTKYM